MLLFDRLKKELDTYLSPSQIIGIQHAYEFADKAHRVQKRASGDPYIIHPVAVATLLAKHHLDPQSIIAALLHDVLEDTPLSKEELTHQFGTEVTKLVDGVSKLTHIQFESHTQAKAENFRKMIMAMADDIRVILIKLADRLHNMTTLCYLSPEKRKRIAAETLEIYAPIANRLGMHNFRIQFEELGFSALYPLRARALESAVKKARGNRKEIISLIESTLENALKEKQLSYRLLGREKHLYSIYQKMCKKHLSFSEVVDIYAFRIILDTVDNCYRTLGILHNLYKPLPEHFDDYIAIPKINGYQSLHTILFGPYGVPIEIQIRTESMDKIAENGIAAHWLYKANEDIAGQSQSRAHEWVKGLLELQQSAGNSIEFIENVKIDLFPDEVYVFTPQGEILGLQHGSTVVDFAYRIHSDIGNKCAAARVERRIIPLSSVLQNGQTIEIVTSPDAHPDPAWLDFVVTAKARSKIRDYLKNQKWSESVMLGKRLIEKALAMQHIFLQDFSQENLNAFFQHSKFKSLEALFEDVGLGNQPAQLAARRLIDYRDTDAFDQTPSQIPLCIKGSEGMVMHYAQCCHPIPGDPIEGVLTAGKGIVVHHLECHNLKGLESAKGKCFPLRWEEKTFGEFDAEIHIESLNQTGLLAHIALIIADKKSNIMRVHVDTKAPNSSLIKLTISVKNLDHLKKIIKHLESLPQILKIARHCNS